MRWIGHTDHSNYLFFDCKVSGTIPQKAPQGLQFSLHVDVSLYHLHTRSSVVWNRQYNFSRVQSSDKLIKLIHCIQSVTWNYEKCAHLPVNAWTCSIAPSSTSLLRVFKKTLLNCINFLLCVLSILSSTALCLLHVILALRHSFFCRSSLKTLSCACKQWTRLHTCSPCSSGRHLVRLHRDTRAMRPRANCRCR